MNTAQTPQVVTSSHTTGATFLLPAQSAGGATCRPVAKVQPSRNTQASCPNHTHTYTQSTILQRKTCKCSLLSTAREAGWVMGPFLIHCLKLCGCSFLLTKGAFKKINTPSRGGGRSAGLTIYIQKWYHKGGVCDPPKQSINFFERSLICYISYNLS